MASMLSDVLSDDGYDDDDPYLENDIEPDLYHDDDGYEIPPEYEWYSQPTNKKNPC